LIKDGFSEHRAIILNKINTLVQKELDCRIHSKLIKILVDAFLQENNSMIDKKDDVRQADMTDNRDISDSKMEINLKQDLKAVISKYRMKFCTKRKEKKIPLQEQQLQHNFYHTIISFGIFISFTGIIFLLTKWKKNKN
jgi:hypothetical protein